MIGSRSFKAAAHRAGNRAAAGAIVAFLAAPAFSAPCVMSVRVAPEPVEAERGVDVKKQGLNVELLREALRRVGCEPRFVELPWKRALSDLEAGALEVLPDAFRLAERERYAHFSRPFIRSRNVVFVAREAFGRFRISRLEDVIGTDFRLGAVIGASYGPEYETLLRNPAFTARIVGVTQRINAWRMIIAGRLDGVIADEVWGLKGLRDLGYDEVIAKSPVVVSDMPAMIAFSKRTVPREFVDRFDAALEAMIADGSYQAILERNLPCRVSLKKLGCE